MKPRLVASVVTGLALMFLLSGSAAAQGGQLVAAEYGAGDHRVDVTPQVRSFMHDGILQFDVNDRNLGLIRPTITSKNFSSASVIGTGM